jgi:hypothetical protein
VYNLPPNRCGSAALDIMLKINGNTFFTYPIETENKESGFSRTLQSIKALDCNGLATIIIAI